MRTDNWPTSSAYAMAIRSDGSIVLAGAADEDMALVGYQPDGTLDTTFDGDGLVRTDLGGYAVALAMVVQEDGKIVVAGSLMVSNLPSRFLIARYNGDGSLDATFDQDGIVTVAVGANACAAVALAMDPLGRVIASGWCYQPGGQPMHEEMAVVRLNSDGSMDTTFDGDGITSVAVGTNSEAVAVAITDDGGILLGGSTTTNNEHDLALARLLEDGTLDAAFGNGGHVVTGLQSIHETASDLAIQPDGRILLCGTTILGGTEDLMLVRFDADGSLDTSFSGGTVTAAIGAFTTDIGRSIYVQPDGKILVAGSAGLSAMMYSYLLLARFLPDGTLDGSFNGGIFMNPVGGSYAIAQAVAIDPDGAVLTAGFTGISTQFHTFVLARFVEESANAVGDDLVTTPGALAFPNPTTGATSIELGGWGSGKVTAVRLVDPAGRDLRIPAPTMVNTGSRRMLQLDLTALQDGCYTAIIDQEGRRQVVALIKR